MFFWKSLAFSMIQRYDGNLISGSSAFSKTSLNIWKLTVHVLLKPVSRQFKSRPWRREWPPTPVFLPGEFHGQRSLVHYSLWGHKESYTTEKLTLSISTNSEFANEMSVAYLKTRTPKFLLF